MADPHARSESSSPVDVTTVDFRDPTTGHLLATISGAAIDAMAADHGVRREDLAGVITAAGAAEGADGILTYLEQRFRRLELDVSWGPPTAETGGRRVLIVAMAEPVDLDASGQPSEAQH